MRLILTNTGQCPLTLSLGWPSGRSRVSPSLLYPSARWRRPGGVPALVERKPSTEYVLAQKGGQRGPSGHGMTSLAPAQSFLVQMGLECRGPACHLPRLGSWAGREPERSLWLNLEAGPEKWQPGTSQPAGCWAEGSWLAHCIQRIPHHPRTSCS